MDKKAAWEHLNDAKYSLERATAIQNVLHELVAADNSDSAGSAATLIGVTLDYIEKAQEELEMIERPEAETA